MRFLIDMGFDVRLAAWLRQRGHEALHVAEAGMQRHSDNDLYVKAVAESRVLLTCDLDFATASR